MNILFVCRGNVARSQMAEALFKKYKEGDYKIKSAGTKLSKPEKKTLKSLKPGTDDVLKSMQEEGIDLSDAKRSKVTKEMVDWADKIFLIVDDTDPVPDYLKESPKSIRWDVLDVKGKDLDFTKKVKNIIKEKVIESDF